MARNTKIEVTSRLNFGKYKGKLVKDILILDIKYLQWAKNSGAIKPGPTLINRI